MNHARKHAFDLGLAISGATMLPGERRTHHDIACFINAAGAHCSWQRCQQLEQRAFRKLRAALYRDKELAEALKLAIKR